MAAPISACHKLGLNVKAHRQTYRMSQAELARRAGLTQAAISKLERGMTNPRLLTLEAIAMAFGQRVHVDFRRKR